MESSSHDLDAPASVADDDGLAEPCARERIVRQAPHLQRGREEERSALGFA